MCYECFLTHKSNRKNILGTYPTFKHAFEGASMNLAENLNKVRTFKKFVNSTEFSPIFPMKTKT